jgi:hypothetical protein
MVCVSRKRRVRVSFSQSPPELTAPRLRAGMNFARLHAAYPGRMR